MHSREQTTQPPAFAPACTCCGLAPSPNGLTCDACRRDIAAHYLAGRGWGWS